MESKKIPYFSRGTYAELKKALSDGVFQTLDRAIYYFVTEGKYAGDFCLVYKDKSIHHISNQNITTQLKELDNELLALTNEFDTMKTSPTAIRWGEI